MHISKVSGLFLFILILFCISGTIGDETVSDITAASLTAPVISSVTPATGANSGMVWITNLAGANFLKGATVKLTRTGQRDIPGIGVNVVSPTRITCLFNLGGAATGSWDLVVTNPGAQSVTLSEGFTVTGSRPIITSFTPNAGPNTRTLPMSIIGTNFRDGAMVTLTNKTLTITGILTMVKQTQIGTVLPITGAPPFIWDLTVRNADGTTVTIPRAFTITNSIPEIMTVSPASGDNSVNTNITIIGTGFRNGVKATLSNGKTILTGTGLIRTGTTRIQCTFPTKDKPTGQYSLTVCNTDGLSVTKPAAFLLQQKGSSPIITSFTPTSGSNTENVLFTISGTNFRADAKVYITYGVTNKTALSSDVTANRITCTLPLKGIPIGIYNLIVKNTDGSTATVTNAFTVTNAAPVISSITPVSGSNNANLPVIITGNNFRAGAEVTIANNMVTKTALSPTVTMTQIACTLPIAGIPTGIFNLTVRNTDGTTAYLTNAFTVTGPGPVISSVTPMSGYNTGTVRTTITGNKFQAGVAVTLNHGETTIPCSIESVASTKIVGSFALSGIPAGTYDLTVTNPDVTSATRMNAFTVLQTGSAPTITGISPSSGFNTADMKVAITGTLFDRPTVTISNGDLTKTAPLAPGMPQTDRIVYVMLPIKGIPGGLYSIIVTNNDGGTATGKDIFWVSDLLFMVGMGQIAPDNAGPGAASAGIILGSSNGGSSAVVSPGSEIV